MHPSTALEPPRSVLALTYLIQSLSHFVLQVFFRAGVLGRLEEARDNKLSSTITELQVSARPFFILLHHTMNT
jgi:hypothetical protein